MISIIGSGRVGADIAFLCAVNALDDILLINRTKDKAIGESLDIANSIPSNSKFSIHGTDDFSKLSDSDIVIVSASVSIYQEHRTDHLFSQVNMIKNIAKKVKQYCPTAIVLIISNPLDVLTYFFQKESQFDRFKVIGIASSLDSSRFHYLLSEKFHVPLPSISNPIVVGEHGDSMVPLFSNIKVNDVSILSKIDENEMESIANNVKNYWKVLRMHKTRSRYGIAKRTFDVIDAFINSKELEISASVVLDGEYDIHDISIGIPVKISTNGDIEIQKINLTSKEFESLGKSSNQIRTFIKLAQDSK